MPNPTGIERAVCNDIAKRQEMGVKKYGHTVADNPNFTKRQWLQHLYEELLDASIYTKKILADMDEQVLGISRNLFTECGGPFHGVSFELAKYFPNILTSESLKPMSRLLAEDDPSFKQIIPYCIVVCSGKVLRYRRGKKGDESRLHGKYSIGIGGHMNTYDGEGNEGYLNAIQRELEEEIGFYHPNAVRIVGLVNDEYSEVGSVHLGIIHVVVVPDESVILQKCDHLVEVEFVPGTTLMLDREREYEEWSRMCIAEIGTILTNGTQS